MPVVGTAGHVDHGKSTLIKALTGRDPDRWEEEKRRGLTIDIGFAWATIDGHEISFVDVPGHERYLKNMLAGIESIDAALLVVAADEGWMPQSEEHLAVIDLLDIGRGVVALTKVDATEGDLAELAVLEVEERLRGTSLESAPIVQVSALTGLGLDELRARLIEVIPWGQPVAGRPRLWIDRSFTIGGAGTVVTGTLLDGSLHVGDTVTILPGGESARIRGLQSHEADVPVASPGRRIAVNLGGVDRSQVPRGSMLGLPAEWATTSRFSASIRTARYAPGLSERADYQLHIGSGAQHARIQRSDDGFAVIASHTPLPLKVGDRFILRDTGRKLVVAGGRVLDPSPGRLGTALSDAATIDPEGSPDEVANALLGIRGVDTVPNLAAHSGGGVPTTALLQGGIAITEGAVERLRVKTRELVAADHKAHPLRPGLPVATLASELGYSLDLVATLIELWGDFERVGPDVRLPEHTPALSEEQRRQWEETREALGQSLAVPSVGDLGLDGELVHLLVRDDQLVRINPSLVVLPEQAEEIRSLIRGMRSGFTVAEFRDAASLSRKYAVPYLEWADSEGLTVRRGDIRLVR